MKHLILVFTLVFFFAIPMFSQDSIHEWRMATKAEKDAIIDSEYAAMAKAGWCCDPPCTMGMGMWSDDVGYSRQPCELINDKGQFGALVTVSIGKKECRITGDQAGELSMDVLIARCANDKLPKLALK